MERSCFSEKTLTLSVLTAEFARCVLQTGAPVTARSFLLRGLPMTARQELLLAAAGPLANLLACAAVLLFMRGAGYSYGGYWFACCNLLVGGSNLLPLPGLDGWRIAGALHGIGRT